MHNIRRGISNFLGHFTYTQWRMCCGLARLLVCGMVPCCAWTCCGAPGDSAEMFLLSHSHQFEKARLPCSVLLPLGHFHAGSYHLRQRENLNSFSSHHQWGFQKLQNSRISFTWFWTMKWTKQNLVSNLNFRSKCICLSRAELSLYGMNKQL